MSWINVPGEKACIVCGGEAVFYVTVRLDIDGDSTSRMKLAQFWLCRSCETANQQVFANDDERKRRIALRLTDYPSFMSHWRDWRGKTYWSPDQVAQQSKFDQAWDDRAIREKARNQAQHAIQMLRARRDKM